MSSATNRRKWTNIFSRSSRKQRRAEAKPGLRVQHLEDRVTPATFYVDSTPGMAGTEFTASGGSQPASVPGLTLGVDLFTSIGAAVAAVTGPTDVINISDGTYTEFFAGLNKASLTIRGNQFGVDARTRGGAETVLNHPQGAFNVTADNVTINGLTIQDTTNTAFLGFAIAMGNGATTGTQIINNIIQNNVAGIGLANTGASQVVIQNNLFQNNTVGGLSTDIYSDQFVGGSGVNNILIDSNKFFNSSTVVDSWAIGISNTAVTNFSDFTITNNEITNHGRGMYFYNTQDATIANNKIQGLTNYGIGFFSGDSNFDILNNSIDGGNRGVYVSRDFPAPNSDIVIHGNSIANAAIANLQVDAGSYSGTLDAGFNWWGSSVLATVSSKIIAPDNNVDYSPYLNSGTDTMPGIPGFQGDESDVTSHSQGANSTPGINPIQDAINNLPAGGGTVIVPSGTYIGNVDASGMGKDVTFIGGASPGIINVVGSWTLNAGDVVEIEIFGKAPGTGYDQWNYTDDVTLGGATAEIIVGATLFPAQGLFDVINAGTDGTGTLTGTFGVVNRTPINIPGLFDYSINTNKTAQYQIAAPATVYVDDSFAGTAFGDDPDGAGPATAFGYDAFVTIQEGVNYVATNGTVNVAAGSYAGGVLINRTLTVSGTGSPTVTSLDLNGQDVGFQYAANGGTLQGFNIVGDGIGKEYGVLLSDKNSAPGYSGGTVQNNTFSNLLYSVATADGAFDYTDSIIQNNTITVPNSGGFGVLLQSGSGHVVYGNSITGINTGFGVIAQFTADVVIGGVGAGQANMITGLASALYATDSTNLSFIGNMVSGMSGVSGAVRLEGNVSGATISQNTITAGVVPAVLLRGDDTPIPNSNVFVNNNFLTNNTYGIRVSNTGLTGTLDARFNDMSGNTSGSILNSDLVNTVDASGSYFGSVSLATVSAGITGSVDYTPYLNLGTDTNGATAGFQGDYSDLTVHATGTQLGGGRIAEGYAALTATGTLHVLTGSYTDSIDLTPAGDRAVRLEAGESPGQVTITGNFTLSSNDTLEIEIGGLLAATQYDNFLVGGDVTLGNAALDVQQFAGFVLSTVAPQSFTIVDNQGTNPVSGTFNGLPEGTKIGYAGGNLYITYQGGDGNDVVLNNYPVINGTAGADTVVLTPTATGYDFTVNGGATQSVVGTLPFAFNGLDGDDVLVVNLNEFVVPSILYDGGAQTAPANAGSNAVFGDVLVVNDTKGTHTATYAGAAALPVNGFAGTVAVMGEGTISFTGLEPVDLIGLAVANVNFANGDDAVTIANGKDAGTNTLDAIVVSGTSGGVGFEQVHLRNNATVNIDTTDVDGNDTVTIAGADNAHGNANIDIDTGAGTDSVTQTGPATFSGTVDVSTMDFSIAGGTLTAGGAVTVAATGTVSVGAGGITNAAGTGNVSLTTTGGTLTVTNTGILTAGNATLSASGLVSINANGINALAGTGTISVTSTGAGVTITNGGVQAKGTVTVLAVDDISISNAGVNNNQGGTGTGSISITSSNGDIAISQGGVTSTSNVTVSAPAAAGSTVSITGPVVGSTVSITTGAGADTVTVTAPGTVVATSGAATISTLGNDDTITIDGPVSGATATVLAGDGVDSITISRSGSAITLDGGNQSDTYTVNVGTLAGAVTVADSGASGTDTLNVNGTAAANTFEVNTATGGDSKVVVDGTQTVNYTKTLEVLNLDGAGLGDTFNVFFTQGGATSFLPATVSIADTGATAGDVANVSGTDNADVIDVNFTTGRTTAGLGSSIGYTNGQLETLNVFSKASADVVFAKAVLLAGGGPVVNLDGGTPTAPTTLPGDILVLDVTGMAGLSTADIKTPAGSVPSTSHNNLTWVEFETIPVPIGLGGTFDFGTATSPVQAGPYVVPPPASYFVGVNFADTYAAKGYYGWDKAVNGYDRGAASPNPAQTKFQSLLRDGNWFGPTGVSRTFSVAAVASGSYQVSVTLGDTAVVMDNVYVTIEGSAQQLVPTVFQNQFITVTGIGSDANADGKIDISFVDKGGTHSYWHVNALDVRPLNLVAPVTITRADGLTTALTADGLTKTTYFAEGFFPNAVVTVGATNGKIASVDVDPFLVGVQVLADGTGKATFELLHPTGNGNVTLTANAAVVVDAAGTFTQAFNLTPSQKIDFNAATTPTEAGYLGFTNTLYAGPATNGLGWLQAVQLGDRGATHGNLFRDFAFNLSGPAARGEFNIDLPTGAPHAVTVYLGDPATARDRLQVEAFDGTGYVVLATEIATSKTNSLTFAVTPVDLGGGNFQVRLRFSDLGGTQNGWSVQGLEYRTLASQGTLGIAPTAAVAGDGTAVTNYAVTGGPAGGLVTLNAKYGAVLGTDASAVYDGFQVLLDGAGAGSFAIQSPVVAAGSLDSPVSLVSVNGSHAGGFTQQYTGAKVSYDFGTGPVAAGFKGLAATAKATAQTGVGFTTAAGGFDRNPASFPNVAKTAVPDLFRDGATGNGTGGFRVLVQAGATNVPVRVYAYDANGTRGTLTVTGEGGASQALPTSLTVPAVFTVLASDANGDGFLDLSIAGFSTWVMNGVEVG